MSNPSGTPTQYVGVKAVGRTSPRKTPAHIPFRPNKIPPNAHRVVKRLFVEMNAQQISQEEMARRSGVSRNTFKDWKNRSIPRLDMIEACLNVLGFELAVRERKE